MQDDAFLGGEASAYFRRNREHYCTVPTPESDLPLRLIVAHGLPTDSVLEVGCANGARLYALCQMAGGAGVHVGVEPSAEAIEHGRRFFPGVLFEHGTMADMLWPGQVALAIVHFVFHWVDRATLLTSVGRLDRWIKPGGWLLLGDFSPERPTRVPYRHLPGLYTYKLPNAYSGLFTATGLYREVDRVVYNHDTGDLGECPDEQRAAVVLLRKEDVYVG